MKTTRVRRSIVAIFLCIVLIGSLSFAQTGWVANGAGTRAAGMGYAFTGLADDASAVTWNPAGIAQLSRPEVSAGFRTIFTSVNIDFPANFGVQGYTYDGTPTFEVNFASLIYPFSIQRHNVSIGVSYRKLYAFVENFKESYTMLSSDYPPVETRYDNEVTASGGVGAYAGTIGVQVTDFLMLGGTVNIIKSSATEMQKGVTGTTVNYDYTYDYDYSGTTVDLGVLVKKDWFSGGVDLNLPQTLTVDSKFTPRMTGYTTFDTTTTIELPMLWGIGVAVRPTDQLTLAADYRIRPLSQTKRDGKVDSAFFADANSFHVGAEYLIKLKDSYLPIRAGFYTQPLEYKDADNNQVIRNIVTTGIGFVMGPVSFDASLEWYNVSYPIYQGVTRKETQWRLNFGGVVHF
jgi:long-subunit fatty acid transport protein